MQKQTTQKERMPARLVAGGSALVISQLVVAAAVKLFGLELTPAQTLEAAAALVAVGQGVQMLAGLVVSRLGK